MVSALRLLALITGYICGATFAFAAEPKELPEAKVEIHWVELFRKEGLTVDRSVFDSGGDSENDYYPHAKPAMTLSRKDIADIRLQQYDRPGNGVVNHYYLVTLVLTKDARERLAKSCPAKSARVSVAVDGKYWGWDHYTTDDDADVSDHSKAKNYSPCMGLMSRAAADSIINAFK